ncbi:hypothetical protein Rt10032_c06g2878 [Rhodotorula toruloides]|uniref:Uncharacterized protein n=1 Tax=Rhodotorula toruloides TaxID=5286 RepID=A0A511KER6_RHOTO|nr:hypothetical protein Rt10032_c06g2878 [Rhodotorula toruloides]
MALDATRVEIPIASTSAVRLDSPPAVRPAAAPTSPPPPIESMTSERTAVDAVALLAALLDRLRAAHSASPDASALEIIERLRTSSFFGDDASRSPPTPPPPIRLDPHPHSQNPRLLTPFLLQALFLGASALGLFARRKVQTPEKRVAAGCQPQADKAKRDAEDRVDQLQALNLLVAAYAVPEVSGVTEVEPLQRWRDECLHGLSQLLGTITASRIPVNRTTIASLLHFVQPLPPIHRLASPNSAVAKARLPEGKYSMSRPVVGLWAWQAWSALPTLVQHRDTPLTVAPDASSDLDDAIIVTFLSLLYPSFEANKRHFFSREILPGADRTVLNDIVRHVFDERRTASLPVLRALAAAAFRARRTDILERFIAYEPPVDPSLHLFAASKILEVLSMDGTKRRRAEIVVPQVELWAKIVIGLGDLVEGDLAVLERAVRVVCTGFAIDSPLEQYLATTVVSLLQSPANERVALSSIVDEALRHLVKSRNPRLARIVFESIPSKALRRSHFHRLLLSSYEPLSQHAWTTLCQHPIVEPTISSFQLRLAALAKMRDYPSSLPKAWEAFVELRRRGLEATKDVWLNLLEVVAMHGNHPNLQEVLSRMKRAGLEADDDITAILVAREMHRTDTQKERVEGEDEWCDRVTVTHERRRRTCGKTQVKRVRAIVRDHEVRDDAARESKAEPPVHKQDLKPALDGRLGRSDILPNMLLANAVRWMRQNDILGLITIANGHLGVDLAGPKPSSSVDPASISTNEFERIRRPAYRTLIRGFTKRKRPDLGNALRLVMKKEEAAVSRLEKQRRREAKAAWEGGG